MVTITCGLLIIVVTFPDQDFRNLELLGNYCEVIAKCSPINTDSLSCLYQMIPYVHRTTIDTGGFQRTTLQTAALYSIACLYFFNSISWDCLLHVLIKRRCFFFVRFSLLFCSVFPLLTIILGTHSASSLFSFFIIVSLAPSVFLAYRITDSETSQTRQPSTVCLLFSFSVHCAILMPFYKDQSCALQQQWPPCLCFQPRATSLASKTLTMFHAQRLLVRLVFLPLSGGETGSDTLLTLLRFLQSFAFRIYRSSKTLNMVDTSNFSRDRTGGTALSSPFHAYFIFYPYQRRYVFC